MRPTLYHMAHGVTPRGDVSALCTKPMTPVNTATDRWTTRIEAVTCPRCLGKIATRMIQGGY